MIRIAITQAAFEAIAQTMPFGSINFEAGVDADGKRYIWLPRAVVDRVRSLRGSGESFSDVILRLAAETRLGSCVDAPVDARGFLTASAMIGCSHVSGLKVRLCHMPRPVWRYAD